MQTLIPLLPLQQPTGMTGDPTPKND